MKKSKTITAKKYDKAVSKINVSGIKPKQKAKATRMITTIKFVEAANRIKLYPTVNALAKKMSLSWAATNVRVNNVMKLGAVTKDKMGGLHLTKKALSVLNTKK